HDAAAGGGCGDGAGAGGSRRRVCATPDGDIAAHIGAADDGSRPQAARVGVACRGNRDCDGRMVGMVLLAVKRPVVGTRLLADEGAVLKEPHVIGRLDVWMLTRRSARIDSIPSVPMNRRRWGQASQYRLSAHHLSS